MEPGAAATLRLLEELLADNAGLVQRAVLAGARLRFPVAHDPRAMLGTAQEYARPTCLYGTSPSYRPATCT